MTLDQKYQAFREKYFKDATSFVEDHYKQHPKIASILLSELAPLTKEEWLNRELVEAIEEENYEFCVELKQEIKKTIVCKNSL
jgi:glutamine synthetase adenylyltransferase